MFDQTSFGKFVLKGKDALAVLQRLCANEIDVPLGRMVYTAMLNARGGFESDLTVLRLAQNEFFIVTGSAQKSSASLCGVEVCAAVPERRAQEGSHE